MKRIDFTNLGGLPFTQNRMEFLQDGTLSAFSAIARLCGDKVILYGIEVNGSNVSNGWFAYNGELIEFIGGSVGAKVSINETAQSFTYANAAVHDVQFNKTATCGPVGDFNFSEFVPLLSLQNTWKKDDVKMSYKDNAYITANFDNQGYGITPAEKGWRIINEAIANSAGRVFVSWQADDADYDQAGKIGGAKGVQLTPAQQGSIDFKGRADDGDNSAGTFRSFRALEINGQEFDASNDAAADGWTAVRNVRLKDDAAAFDKRQSFMVMLTLIKL